MTVGEASGKVWLVGAGPGDPGLITVAGLEALRQADVVVYDRLVSPLLLTHARPDAELLFVGKEGGGESFPQRDIERLLVEKARQGKRVVRLKGGDPFVFGRGGEECLALAEAGVPFEVVPGVTSAVAAPAYAGIPVTHRGLSSSLAIVTGHEDAAKAGSSLRWDRLATAADTLVVLMGTRTLSELVERLLAHGRPADTPVAVVRWGTTPEQEVVTGTLADIVPRVEKAGLRPPTVVVVGQVVRLRQRLLWFERRPLFGRRVLVTRARHQAGELSRMLLEAGALPVEVPVIEIEPLDEGPAAAKALDGLARGDYRWLLFTSANAVDHFFRLLEARGRDARALAGVRVAAIGPGTAQALHARGIRPDLLPREFVAEGLAAALSPHLRPGDGVLLPRAEEARPALVEALAAVGARVDILPLYRTRLPKDVPRGAIEMLRQGEIDAVAFTASSTVRNLAALLGEDVGRLQRVTIACIGPITARAVREVLGRSPDVVAQEYTMAGLVEALCRQLGPARAPEGS
ncbi:MAG TPA: uroporphyrinogen-III C-methyltransferase [Dehalococcoidia bacterium]|nr:uroporphyrinogen-III C-methyltransferase [Dehalococcoidia bacterium]